MGFLGDFIIDGYENNKNNWHYVKITIVDAARGIYKWTNRAKVSWTLTLRQGSKDTLIVGKECPYWKSGHKEAKLTYEGGRVVAIAGPHGEIYRVAGGSKPAPKPAPRTEPTKLFKQGFLGDYIIDGYDNNKNDWHYVKISIVDAFKGIYKWTNRAKKSWTLTVK